MARFVLSLVITPTTLMKRLLKQRWPIKCKSRKGKGGQGPRRQETHDLPRKAGVASIEGDIEALENRIAAIEEEMQANGSDFGN